MQHGTKFNTSAPRYSSSLNFKDRNSKGYFETYNDLIITFPLGESGDWAIVGSTNSIWIWDHHSNSWINTNQFFQLIFNFNISDWIYDSITSLKYIEITHNLNIPFPNITVLENNEFIWLHSIQILNKDVIKIFITDSEEFNGILKITS